MDRLNISSVIQDRLIELKAQNDYNWTNLCNCPKEGFTEQFDKHIKLLINISDQMTFLYRLQKDLNDQRAEDRELIKSISELVNEIIVDSLEIVTEIITDPKIKGNMKAELYEKAYQFCCELREV